MNADVLAYLAGKGLSLDEIIEVARLAERKRDNTAAERQARHRARKRNGVTSRCDPLIEEDHNPSSHISPDGENENTPRASKSNPFPKPAWAEDQVWADWLDIRKSKKARNTATAHAGFLTDIASLANDEWPPGRLLKHAVSRSWAGIFEPKEGYPTSGRPHADTFASLRGSRPNGALDMVLQAERELAAEAQREDPRADWPARAALPSH